MCVEFPPPSTWWRDMLQSRAVAVSPLNGGCSEGLDAFRSFFKLCRDTNDIRLVSDQRGVVVFYSPRHFHEHNFSNDRRH